MAAYKNDGPGQLSHALGQDRHPVEWRKLAHSATFQPRPRHQGERRGGKDLFTNTVAAARALSARGAKTGPDLTGADRKNAIGS